MNTKNNTDQKKKNRKKEKVLTPKDLLKMEIAEELGLTDKVQKYGWGSLSAAETGRIGGIMTSKIKKQSAN